ncbi:trimeric intracellular cation channel family protein [Arthrobacter crystallopoietes]|uniref:trimeric intracellular cation channel family protein n=1 Tax=Crystallibacter crystallopoietes TaxID=37928 RepID=UPI001ABE7CDB|nr:TRIC cation channel family protein [Arthrobacter crystallopoietes]QTG82957.1 TRIC cation channel family protein [Arthrobacter crystallopoietes]
MLLILDLFGTFFFAMSGCLLAARRNFDIVGSLLLGSLVGLGGGVIRDVIISQAVPTAFVEPIYLIAPVLAAAVVYFHVLGVQRFRRTLLIFDAGGLALFCVTGTLKALDSGMGPVTSAVLGITTAVGGGVLRDVVANEVPQIFNPRGVYAVPAMLGASLVTLFSQLGWFNAYTGTAIAAVVFLLRVLSLRFGWRIPLAGGAKNPSSATD